MSQMAGGPVNNRDELVMSMETLCPVHRVLCDERGMSHPRVHSTFGFDCGRLILSALPAAWEAAEDGESN